MNTVWTNLLLKRLLGISFFFLFIISANAQTNGYYGDYIRAEIIKELEKMRPDLYKTLTPEEKKIERSIQYVFSDIKDRTLVEARIENRQRKIIISKTFCDVIFRVADILLIESKFSKPTQKIHTYKYIDHLIETESADWKTPENFAGLSKQQKVEFNNLKNVQERFGMYLYSIAFALIHETYHHLEPDHLDSKQKFTLDEVLRHEINADDFAMFQLSSISIPPIVGLALSTYYYMSDKQQTVAGTKRTHPSGINRSLMLMNHCLSNFDEVEKMGREGGGFGNNTSPKELYFMIREGVLNSTYELLAKENRPIRYYQKMAERGNVDAQTILGYKYWLGVGSQKRDIELAEKWLAEAWDGGSGLAAYFLGMMYEVEYGKPNLAFKFYESADIMGLGLAREHALMLHNVSDEVFEKGKDMPQGIRNLRERCMKDCQDNYKNSESDCAENYCKNHISNMNGWIFRFWIEKINEDNK